MNPTHCTCESSKRGKGSTCRTCGKPIDLMASLEDSLRRARADTAFSERLQRSMTEHADILERLGDE